MVVVVIASCITLTFAAPNINNAFAKDPDDSIDSYIKAYKWNEDLFNKIRWTYDDEDDENDEDILWFKRRAGYQTDFWDDNIETTKKYLGLADGAYGFGNGNNIVAVAEGQYGAEDSYEVPLGSNNVKYNTWYYGGVVSGSSYPWCCAFVSWCADQCGYIESGLFQKTAACFAQYLYLTQTMGFESYRIENTTQFGGSEYTPVPGDIMFFSTDYGARYDTTSFEHIGIIVEVNDDGWYTVEGNYGDKVSRNWFTPSNAPLRVWHGLLVHVEYPEGGVSGEGPEAIYGFLTTCMGMTRPAALGALGNMQRESGCDPNTTEIGYTWETGAGYGIIQWTNTNGNTRLRTLDSANLQSPGEPYREVNGHRRTNLVNWCNANGYNYRTLEGQLYFLRYEIDNYSPYKNAVARMNQCADTLEGAKEATRIWLNIVEGLPTSNRYWSSEISIRTNNTVRFWEQFAN